MKHILLTLVITLATTAQANSLVWNDSWTGRDKQQHLVGGAVIASGVTIATNNPALGFVAGCGAGILKETYDLSGTGTPSAKDMVVTCAGAFIGAKLTEKLYITPNRIEYKIKF
jgi:uncharacterized protein YfiM (DUF2279 family)